MNSPKHPINPCNPWSKSSDSRSRLSGVVAATCKIALAGILCLSISGCVSLGVRHDYESDYEERDKVRPPYCGVLYFYESLFHSEGYMVNIIVFFLPTFPLDFAFDTLLLPYDIPSYYYHSHKVKEKRKKKKEEIEASHKRKITPDTDDGTDPNCSYPDCPYPNGTDDATATDGTDGDGTD